MIPLNSHFAPDDHQYGPASPHSVRMVNEPKTLIYIAI
jgi:hypothetical protein